MTGTEALIAAGILASTASTVIATQSRGSPDLSIDPEPTGETEAKLAAKAEDTARSRAIIRRARQRGVGTLSIDPVGTGDNTGTG